MDNLSIKQRRKFRYRDGVSMQDVIKVNRNLTQEKFDIKITENNNDVKMLLVNPLHNLWIFLKTKVDYTQIQNTVCPASLQAKFSSFLTT